MRRESGPWVLASGPSLVMNLQDFPVIFDQAGPSRSIAHLNKMFYLSRRTLTSKESSQKTRVPKLIRVRGVCAGVWGNPERPLPALLPALSTSVRPLSPRETGALDKGLISLLALTTLILDMSPVAGGDLLCEGCERMGKKAPCPRFHTRGVGLETEEPRALPVTWSDARHPHTVAREPVSGSARTEKMNGGITGPCRGAQGCLAGGGSSLWQAALHSGTSFPHKGSSLSFVAAVLSPSALSPGERERERECFVLFLASRGGVRVGGEPELTWGLPDSCLINSPSNPTSRYSSSHSGPHFVDGKAEVQRGVAQATHTVREGQVRTCFLVTGSTEDYLNNPRAWLVGSSLSIRSCGLTSHFRPGEVRSEAHSDSPGSYRGPEPTEASFPRPGRVSDTLPLLHILRTEYLQPLSCLLTPSCFSFPSSAWLLYQGLRSFLGQGCFLR